MQSQTEAGGGRQSPRRLAIIMAGGSGERFWPLSRKDRPKQLLRLSNSDETLLEEAVRRIQPLVGEEGVIIATGRPLEGPIRDAKLVGDQHVFTEPAKRNTLGCLAWAAANLLAREEHDTTMAVLTADHKIGNPDLFRATVETAMQVAENTGGIVTIGVAPSRPETGYGYIEVSLDKPVRTGNEIEAFAAKSFREKPSIEAAREYVFMGDFLWNSGMFFWTVSGFVDEMAAADPESYAIILDIADALRSKKTQEAERFFEQLPNKSIDYALLEKARTVFVVRGTFPWDDIGAWDALERSLPTDEAGNVIEGNVISLNSRNSIVYNDLDNLVVATMGIEDLIVVVTHDAVLVCPKSHAQEVKNIVAALEDHTR